MSAFIAFNFVPIRRNKLLSLMCPAESRGVEGGVFQVWHCADMQAVDGIQSDGSADQPGQSHGGVLDFRRGLDRDAKAVLRERAWRLHPDRFFPEP